MQLSEVTVKGLLVQRIREDIIRGSLTPGERLRLRDLAERYDVSTQPIRQALGELEAEGLVQTTPRKGSMVSVLSVNELGDLYEVRATLESMAAGSAVRALAESDSAEAIKTLNALITAMDEHMGEVVELVSLNKRFHLTLYECSGRKNLCELIGTLRNRTSHYLHAYMIDLGGMPLAQDEHRAIVTAIEQEDAALAESVMHDHVMKAGESIIDYVQRQDLAELDANE